MSDSALAKVTDHARKGAEARDSFFARQGEKLVEAGRAMAVSLARGGKILLCGNGGGAADCQRVASLLINRFDLERPALPAISLTADTSVLTALGNDMGYDAVFERQVRALGNAGDVFFGICAAGNSHNVLLAMREARRMGMVTVGLTGPHGKEMGAECDHIFEVPSKSPAVAQEIHIAATNSLCMVVDHFLFEAVLELSPYLEQADSGA